MKKLLTGITALVIMLVSLLSLSACAETELQSKIRKVTFSVEYFNEAGESEGTFDINARVFVNFAPKTIEQFAKLVNDGYYNGLPISNVTSNYAQFGDYKVVDGEYVAVDGNVSTVVGEFLNNGWSGSKITVKKGALVLVRDSKDDDSGKATVAVCFNGSAFDTNDYCVFGYIYDNDGSTDEDADTTLLENMSSIQRAAEISKRISDSESTRVYYCLKGALADGEPEFITYAKYEDEFRYFKGKYTSEQIAALTDAENLYLTDKEVTTFKERLNKNTSDFYTVPCSNVVIKSVTISD